MAMVQVSGLRKSFGALEVVKGVSIDIRDGEFLILVGPSGCGKSTLLRMIAGLEDISGGRIEIAGRVVNALSPKERNIAMVFQNYALYPQMTVAQNMGFSLEISGMKKAEIEKKVADASEILGLNPLLQRKPSQLSGGQRQRVAMGRAIVRDPDVFLFDEPLSNLDAKLRVQMRAEIKALHQRLGSTIVYVTHDQVEAMTMADRIVVLRAGRVEQIGTPLELYDHPENMFVAGFLGSPSMNFLRGTIEGGSLLLSGGERLVLPSVPRNAGGELVVGIRPQGFAIGTQNGAKATVKVVEPTGADTHVLADIGGTEITCVVNDRVDFAAGQEIRLSISAAQVHFFDPVSEERID
ncbi:sn-glycerol-3-phosphate ABC transporter ATP-binding protein UgpC [Rhizobiales bacterium RZME27]|uniref:sn-glycerol-3-phosphate ABC transporter ATP-binding protein UgpC n=1 Tax=Endobacterium cereale TaxID=2663029 RepID=A0A6A8A6N2_9HYPH|nr:sn-glycerol-3-phosphate ABC transporter ATP-binding protein UgpC [Endobacterium cereale]MEB2847850.1 sn-glycerol-3-phosphate ABC transporter ATP-binding protein UgpC [Endobacterium cereale]MQY46813.1 sn-glycerol-3-phosphate ABC transporter ATP-binding protein UgpC [Endobacterium cereale]